MSPIPVFVWRACPRWAGSTPDRASIHCSPASAPLERIARGERSGSARSSCGRVGPLADGAATVPVRPPALPLPTTPDSIAPHREMPRNAAPALRRPRVLASPRVSRGSASPQARRILHAARHELHGRRPRPRGALHQRAKRRRTSLNVAPGPEGGAIIVFTRASYLVCQDHAASSADFPSC